MAKDLKFKLAEAISYGIDGTRSLETQSASYQEEMLEGADSVIGFLMDLTEDELETLLSL